MNENFLKFNSKEFRKDMFEGAKFFHHGIWISYDYAEINRDYIHPSGIDFINFKYIENGQSWDNDGYGIEKYRFDLGDISNGIYENHPFENYTLEEILDVVGERGWFFERP